MFALMNLCALNDRSRVLCLVHMVVDMRGRRWSLRTRGLQCGPRPLHLVLLMNDARRNLTLLNHARCSVVMNYAIHMPAVPVDRATEEAG